MACCVTQDGVCRSKTRLSQASFFVTNILQYKCLCTFQGGQYNETKIYRKHAKLRHSLSMWVKWPPQDNLRLPSAILSELRFSLGNQKFALPIIFQPYSL